MSPVRALQHAYSHQVPVLVKESILVTIDLDKEF